MNAQPRKPRMLIFSLRISSVMLFRFAQPDGQPSRLGKANAQDREQVERQKRRLVRPEARRGCFRRPISGSDWIYHNSGNAAPARDGSDWTLVPFLVLVLVLLRVVPAVVRRVVPFSAELLEAWYVRRRTAKAYDSYQWRNLMWIGAGLALYVAVSGQHRPVHIALSLFCLVTGAGAAVRWHAVATDSKLPKPTARKIKSAAA